MVPGIKLINLLSDKNCFFIYNIRYNYQISCFVLTIYQLIAYNNIVGGESVNLKIISLENDVRDFLRELKEVLTDTKFDVSKDLDILQKKSSELPTDPYTTANTLLALDFDKNDVLNQLLALDISEYMGTIVDDKDNSWPPFFAFGKTIKNREVYIKAKIRDRKNCKVFCVSFHFARYPLPTKRPYA